MQMMRSGCAISVAAAQEHIADDGLVRRTRRERIGAGQVDDGDRPAVLRVGGAGLLLDGDARVVADLLPQAGERIEERAFAAVGVADEGVDRRAAGVGGFLI